MRIALNRVTAGGGLAWDDFLRLAAKVGYDAVDVDLDALRTAGAGAVKSLLAELKLYPAAVGMPVEFRKDDAAFDEGMKRLDADARLAAEVGCPRMATWVPPAYETPAEQMRVTLRKRFTAIAEVLRPHGVRFGIEFITPLHLRQKGHPCVWQMADMLALAASCGDNVGLLLDAWHWHHDPDATVEDIVRAGRERIVHVHLNDAADQPPEEVRDNQRVLPGEGVIDLKGFAGALNEIGYDGAGSLEIFGRLKDVPAEEAARMALDATRKALAT